MKQISSYSFFTYKIHTCISIILLVVCTTYSLTAQSIGYKKRDNPQKRFEFEKLRTQDPATGQIPYDIHQKEMYFLSSQTKAKGAIINDVGDLNIGWYNRGPHNLGGRTRALAVDVNDSDIILAGGVSGGIWKSTDGGSSWTKTTGANDLQSATCVVQDPRVGHTDVWYYGTGEFIGNSAGGGGSADYRGDGMYKSTDGGNTWTLLSSTSTGKPQTFDQNFDYVYNIVVHPTTGDVYVAHYNGVSVSRNGGLSFSTTLRFGDLNTNPYTDVTMTAQGTAYAVLSTSGVYTTTNGTNWTRISDDSFVGNAFRRKVITTAPSDDNIVYVLGDKSTVPLEYTFLRYNKSTTRWTDLSINLPRLGGVVGDFNSQSGYNLMIRVHPTNPDLIVLGGVNLWRSTDAFKTSSNTTWIGGYTFQNNTSLYPNHHPDQHNFIFLGDTEALSANDGGVQYTTDITSVASDPNSEPHVVWNSLNNGYLTTQVYAVSASRDSLIISGFQDNGSWLGSSSDGTTPWKEVLGADGGYNAISTEQNKFYLSSQQGHMVRADYDPNTLQPSNYQSITPNTYTTPLFIVPFYLDPQKNNVMYLGGGRDNSGVSKLFVNTDVSGSFPKSTWKEISLSTAGIITEIGVSQADIVYFGTTDGRVYKVADPSGRHLIQDITASSLPVGYVSSVAVNQYNEDEVLLTFSNYSIPSIFHTIDGGRTWTDVGGTLEENRDGSGSGPSVRSSSILGDGYRYFVGTSAGLYSTTSLSGASTTWTQVAPNQIGSVVVEHLVQDPNGLIVAGTHGNGVYSAQYEGFSMNITNNSIDENQPTDVVVGTLSLSGIGASSENPTFTIAQNDYFVISGDTLKSKSTLNFEAQSEYDLEVVAALDNGFRYRKTLSIKVEDENDKPTDLQLSATSIFDNEVAGDLVATITTVDEDKNQTHTYILSGDDKDDFTIAGDKLSLAKDASTITKQTNRITISSDDGAGGRIQKDFAIIKGLNNPPTDISIDNSAVEENLSQKRVGILSTTDIDIDQRHVYTILEGNDQSQFVIRNDTLYTNTALDYETKNRFTLKIRSTDDANQSTEKDFIIQVLNANDPPTGMTLDNLEVSETLNIGDVIGTFTITDQDVDDTYQYKIIIPDDADPAICNAFINSYFRIENNEIKLNKKVIHYSKQEYNTYTIWVEVSDSGGATLRRNFTFNVTSSASKSKSASALRVYPNPFEDGNLYLSILSTDYGMIKVNIYSSAGVLAKQFEKEKNNDQQIFELDVRHLPKGVYILEIITPSGIETRKVTKK